MKSIVGLLEYTVTGAIFWILFFVFMTMAGMGADPNRGGMSATEVWASWAGMMPSLQVQVPDSGALKETVKETASLAVSGVLFIAIFSTGLLLDLLAPQIFSVIEIGWARKWLLREKRPWLDDLTRENGELIASDYEAQKAGSRWRPIEWRVEEYRRLTMFLTSYVLATSKAGQLEDFLDRLKLWRVSQGISLSLGLFLLALLISWVLPPWSDHHLSLFEALLFRMMIPLGLLFGSYMTMHMTFFRFVIALETAAYLGGKQAQRAARQPAAAAA